MTASSHDPEMEGLFGAYVLDALDPEERERVEAYLAQHPEARADVDEMQETTVLLATAPLDVSASPPELWQKIVAEISTTTDAPQSEIDDVDEVATRAAMRTRAAMSTRVPAVLAVAAAIAVVVLAVQVVSLNHRLDRANEPGSSAFAAAFNRAAKLAGAQTAALTSDGGAQVARAVLLPDGTGYLVNDDLEKLPPDRTYQLWAATGDAQNPTIVSAGVLGANPKAAAFKVAGPVSALMLTNEPAGGVAQPGAPPVASAAI